MKRIRINLIITLVTFAVLALLIIQFLQIAQLYNRKSDQLHHNTIAVLERTTLVYDKANNLNRYLSLSQKDFGQEYKEILKEEFKKLRTFNENINIKDTNIVNKGQSKKYIIISGKSLDSLTNKPITQRVLARDVNDVSEIFNKDSENVSNISSDLSEELDSRVMDQIYKKSKYISSLMLQMFRENTYESLNDKINLPLLDSILETEIKRSNLPTDFSFSLLDERLKPIIFETNAKRYNQDVDTHELVFTNLFPGNVIDADVFLALNFESKTTFLIKEIIGVLIISIGLVIIIFLTLAFMLRTIVKQKKLSELKNDFISNITHEFKTPISTISLACQALEDKDMSVASSEESLPFVKMIVSENNRLSTLVESVLQSSLMERGELILEMEPTNLTDLVNEICTLEKERMDSLNGTFDCQLPDEPIFINCDQMHTSQAIFNLIDNAIKYTKGTPNIKIILKKEHSEVKLSVVDKGVGIDKEHMSKIFDKLYRIPTGNVHDVKGFGLGLNYVESIVKAHNWQIKVKSTLNKGSEFTLIMK